MKKFAKKTMKKLLTSGESPDKEERILSGNLTQVDA